MQFIPMMANQNFHSVSHSDMPI